jgi:hypothetical protein
VLLPGSIGECFRVRVEELHHKAGFNGHAGSKCARECAGHPMPRKPDCEITLGISSSILSREQMAVAFRETSDS